MKTLLLLSALCLVLNLTAQNNPPAESPLHHRLSELREGGILPVDDLKVKPDQFKARVHQSPRPTITSKSSFDAIQLQDSIYYWRLDFLSNELTFNIKTTEIIYDGNNNIIGFTDSDWDGFDWVKYYQYAYTYDGNHNPTSYIRRSWDGISWQSVEQITYGYDANNNKVSLLAQNWNGTEWVGYERYTYTYNENNDETSRLQEQWENNAWVNDFQQISTYDPNYNPIHILLQEWISNAWENTEQTTSTYDGNNNPVVTLDEEWDGTAWVNLYQTTYVHDAANNLISEEFLIWDGAAWQNQSFYTYTYDANNNQATELYQVGDNGNWINAEYTIFTYDAGNKLTKELFQMWSGFEWEDYEQYLYAYDNHDNLMAFEIQEWSGTWNYTRRERFNFDENDFLRYTVAKAFDESGLQYFGDSIHYYYRTITAIHDDLRTQSHVAISPNPANDLITIASENEINGINVYTIFGKKIYASEKTLSYKTNEIDISSWPSGVYLVLVDEGDNFFTTKLVIQ